MAAFQSGNGTLPIDLGAYDGFYFNVSAATSVGAIINASVGQTFMVRLTRADAGAVTWNEDGYLFEGGSPPSLGSTVGDFVVVHFTVNTGANTSVLRAYEIHRTVETQ
jgi:hypothetical protein